MRNTKTAIFVLAAALVLSACASGPKRKVTDSFTLSDPTNTVMLTANCKAYIDAMRAQEKALFPGDNNQGKYKYSDLNGEAGVSVEDYLDTGDVEGKNQTVSGKVPNRSDRSEPINLKFTSKLSAPVSDHKILISTTETFKDAKQFDVKDDFSADVNNLMVNTQYYWKVITDKEESPASTFTTADYPRWMSARPVYNVRDNGGYMTISGQRVKQGLVFRGGEITTKSWSEHLKTYSAASKKVFREDMNIGIELDLRGSSDIGDGYKACAFADKDEKTGVKDIDYEMHAIKSYEQTFTQTRTEVPKIFKILANANNKHVYYHCYGGADRTGTVGFLLNGLLGVSYTDLVIDFELTSYSSINNEHIRNHKEGHQHQYDRWPALINQLKTDTTNGYVYDENALLKDNIENFLVKACKVPQETINTIKTIMLEPAK